MPSDNARRNVFLLALCQALFMTTTSAVVTMVALIGNMLAEDKTLTTLPIALQFASTMATTVPASFYMKRVGRQIGFVTGATIGCIGALIGAYAIFMNSFSLFCFGAMCFGSFSAFAQYFRFAAAEAADEHFRAKAISLVLAGGVVAAVTGPNLARLTKDLFEPVVYAGTYVSLVVVYLLIVIAALSLRMPERTAAEQRERGRPLREIARQPMFIVAVLAATAAYSTMSLLMTVVPLAMKECDFTFSDSAWVIQGHILGMFVPSFFTGHLINRFGVLNVMLAGAVLFVATLAIDLAGVAFVNFFVGMTMVGVGWNFLFIGGTTLLTQTHAPSERAKVQGLNDFMIWSSVMLGVFASGALQADLGWTFVNVGSMPVVGLALGLTLWLKLSGRKFAPTAQG
jgi:predicted MFS family arabinose efflux permease